MQNPTLTLDPSPDQRERGKILFTPGPLTTSRTVKEAMLVDYGSRDKEFIRLVADIRQKLVSLGGGGNYTSVIMQGSGTFGLESVLSTVIPKDGKLLVVVNGAYGRRLVQIAKVNKIDVADISCPENQTPDFAQVETALKDTSISHVAVVHCETTTGILNPIKEIGQLAARYQKTYIVDAMSSFGAVPVNLADCAIDYLVSSSNKCIEGVPGFSFVLANQDKLANTEGQARTLTLDLYAQYKGLQTDGQFRFTPPTHSLAAFGQALAELEQEGGVDGRMRRYQANHKVLVKGMRELGFAEYLPAEKQCWIITSFVCPKNPAFNFEAFYQSLSDRGFVIYPGKVSNADCFRIGTIGQIDAAKVNALLIAIGEIRSQMGF